MILYICTFDDKIWKLVAFAKFCIFHYNKNFYSEQKCNVFHPKPEEGNRYPGTGSIKNPSTEEWIKKVWYIYAMEYYSAIKMNEILPFAAMRMDLENLMLSEIRQPKTNTVCYHLYVKC